jgi:hypothetical protein
MGRQEQPIQDINLLYRHGKPNARTNLSYALFKDIVQPKKRGVERGTIRTVLTSYTFADIFLTHVKG